MTHPLITECRSLGISIVATNEGLEIVPASKLNDELRSKLIDAKPELLAELSGAEIIPIRWPEFVQLCVSLGATAEEVRAMFSELDIRDLCEESSSTLEHHAQTIVDAIKKARSSTASIRKNQKSK